MRPRLNVWEVDTDRGDGPRVTHRFNEAQTQRLGSSPWITGLSA